MPLAAHLTDPTAAMPVSADAGRRRVSPFAGLIDPVLVDEPANFAFSGSVARGFADAAWVWAVRDLCADLISQTALEKGMAPEDLEPVMPQLLLRIRDAMQIAGSDPEASRRLRVGIGHESGIAGMPTLQAALRARSLLGKAQSFGRAVNSIGDDVALGTAMQSMPLQDQPLAALLFHAALGQVANPTRLVTASIRLSGSATEAALTRAGFAPVIDAVLAHAQNQTVALQTSGPFADIDLVCRSLDRFHRLVRAVTGYVEISRGSRWAVALTGITKTVSDRIEPRLKSVVADLNLAMRRGQSVEHADTDGLLAALNGIYLLATLRDCRDSLALNALFDQVWSQAGQALELHLQRNLDLVRQNPSDVATGERLDAGIKMAEIRFNPEYAETLRRARHAAERRS
jgi:hypothetical protein